jgi:hypothetical protein
MSLNTLPYFIKLKILKTLSLGDLKALYKTNREYRAFVSTYSNEFNAVRALFKECFNNETHGGLIGWDKIDTIMKKWYTDVVYYGKNFNNNNVGKKRILTALEWHGVTRLNFEFVRKQSNTNILTERLVTELLCVMGTFPPTGTLPPTDITPDLTYLPLLFYNDKFLSLVTEPNIGLSCERLLGVYRELNRKGWDKELQLTLMEVIVKKLSFDRTPCCSVELMRLDEAYWPRMLAVKPRIWKMLNDTPYAPSKETVDACKKIYPCINYDGYGVAKCHHDPWEPSFRDLFTNNARRLSEWWYICYDEWLLLIKMHGLQYYNLCPYRNRSSVIRLLLEKWPKTISDILWTIPKELRREMLELTNSI